MDAQRYEISFEATPELGPAALQCLLWRRGKLIGPIALLLFPLLLAILAADPAYRTIAAALGGAAIMLFVIFLLVVWQRRRLFRRFLESAGNRTLRVVFDARGVSVASALGESFLDWRAVARVWRCKHVALLFYHGWSYIAMPAHALSDDALAFALQHIGRRER
jgi:hypothetical protein